MTQNQIYFDEIVGSSQLIGKHYDHENLSLYLKFKSKDKDGNNKVYRYHPVGEDMYSEFSKSESKGSFLAKNLKNNPMITCTKVH